ncbi:chemotaxis protein CheW [Paenibacillus sp. CAA11]|uniref:chemotaxis protein CheW n=1 Tax=Paenibacillus sp. CAA11 TaxID=1532905 RepID=UPI00131F116E|nr:chemotaxis protein CheW [Paenibacillus sp. CAA11]
MTSLQQSQYIELMVEKEVYAIPIHEIQEIIKMAPVTELPTGHPAVEGITHLRGQLVPVISLRRMFGFSSVLPSKTTRIVIVKLLGKTFGLIADQANRVVYYPQIEPPPSFLGGITGGYFLGIARREEHLIGILRLEELLSDF